MLSEFKVDPMLTAPSNSCEYAQYLATALFSPLHVEQIHYTYILAHPYFTQL